MRGYATYILGAETFYPHDLVQIAQQQIYRDGFMTSRWHCYFSNWRILHIDGFEPGFGSRTIHFEWAQKFGKVTHMGNYEWMNAGKAPISDEKL